MNSPYYLLDRLNERLGTISNTTNHLSDTYNAYEIIIANNIYIAYEIQSWSSYFLLYEFKYSNKQLILPFYYNSLKKLCT